jgi:hypothetical protein
MDAPECTYYFALYSFFFEKRLSKCIEKFPYIKTIPYLYIMTRFYRFLDIHKNEVCINPKYVLSIDQFDYSDHYTIEMVNGRRFKLRSDINILCDALEMTANNKIDYGK